MNLQPPQPPAKWKKYLLLVKYGLLTLEELERDIRRYPAHASSKLKKELQQDLEGNSDSNKSLYVIKLVPLQQQGQLPNLRITQEADINIFNDFLNRHYNVKYSEIWYCKTNIATDVFSVAGRISFNPNGNPNSQIIEQVWRCSPRLIESFGKNFRHPYARASRYTWGWHYHIEEIFCTEMITDSQQRQELHHSLRLIERQREPIEIFLEALEFCGEKSVSLEYKIISNTLSIIDWDTPNDLRILEKLDVLRIL